MNGKRARAIRRLEHEGRVATRLGLDARIPAVVTALREAHRGGPGWRARAELPPAELELRGDARAAANALEAAGEEALR